MQLGKNGYISQITIYLKNKDYQNAHNLSKEFSEIFPDEIVARFFLAESAYWSGDYRQAAIEGHRAFNKATDYQDMLSCAMVVGSAHFELKEYAKGLEILKHMEKRVSSDKLEKMMFTYFMAMHNTNAAARHIDELYKMNREMAMDVLEKYFKS